MAYATRAIAARAERLDPGAMTTAFRKEDRGGRVFLDATRAGSGTVVCVYSPLRPGVPVSWPLAWEELDGFRPDDVTITNALDLLAGRASWDELTAAPQQVPAALVEEGPSDPDAASRGDARGRTPTRPVNGRVRPERRAPRQDADSRTRQ